MTTHRDPVCGMQVDESSAAGHSDHGGQTYYFCGAGCQAKFEAAPETYISAAGTESTDAPERA